MSEDTMNQTTKDAVQKDERADFEQFLRDKKFPVLPVWKDGRPHQNYALEVMFDAWMARAATTSAKQAKELTNEQILSIWDGVSEPFGDGHITAFAHAILAAAAPSTGEQA